jgi:transcriptional regulator
MADSREVVQGTLDLLILSSLRPGALHGYAIAQRIRDRSGRAVLVTTGALYPALHRLEGRRLVKARWQVSDTNRRARFYELTAAGHKALGEELAWWNRFVAAVAAVAEPA